jgi:5'-nucleotidase
MNDPKTTTPRNNDEGPDRASAPLPFGAPEPERRIFCNRTLNMRRVKAIGYDMDYTLIHYQVERWERRAYAYLRQKLSELGWPVRDLTFEPEDVIRGLIIDRELGNLIKANQFGYIKSAAHGSRMLSREAQRKAYGDELVDLADKRWAFLNTLFSLSEAAMYSQLVDLLDAGDLPRGIGYGELYESVRSSLDAAHVEGELKAEIMRDPESFVDLDPLVPLTLLDQKAAGKRLLLITNSEWEYTLAMMAYAFDPYLPEGVEWRDLFDLVIVAARKPAFFWESMPLFEVVDDSGLARPVRAEQGQRGVFLGGNAALVETQLGLSGSEILYVGDHVFGDVHVSKGSQRWRTALILRELEDELRAARDFEAKQDELSRMMRVKAGMEFRLSQLRLDLQRRRELLEEPSSDSARGSAESTANSPAEPDASSPGEIEARIEALRAELIELDTHIAPLAVEASRLHNPRWGLITRSGNDKSLLAEQIERHADVYSSRVSNFLLETPFAYLRPPSGRLPHDIGLR